MTSTGKPKLDFTKYRRQELVDSVSDLVDVKAVYARGLLLVLFVALLAAAIVGVIFLNKLEGWQLWTVVAVGAFSGLLIGTLIAIFRFINRSFGNLTSIVDQLLELTKVVTVDIREIDSGAVEVPNTQELVRGLYSQVVLPIVEESVAGQLGFLGGPVLFVYRLTLGNLVRWTIKLLPADKLSSGEDIEKMEQLVDKTKRKMRMVAQNEERILSTLTTTQSHLRTVGFSVRGLVLLPILFTILMLLLTVVIMFTVLARLIAERVI